MITLWLLDVIKNYWSEGFPFFELMIRVDFLCFCGFCMQLSVNEKIEDLEVFELFASFLLRGIFFLFTFILLDATFMSEAGPVRWHP